MGKNPYISVRAAVVIPLGFAAGAGLFIGALVGSIYSFVFFSFSLSLQSWLLVTLLAGSIGLLGGWIWGLKWWIKAERQYYFDAYDLQVGNGRVKGVVTVQTIEGSKQLLSRGAFTPAQLFNAAEILLPLDGRFNLRSIYSIFGQTGAVEFRDWLVVQGYAIIDNRGVVEITTIGLDFLKAASKQLIPYPTRDGSTAIYRDTRAIYTHTQ